MKFFPKKVINAELEGKARRVRADEKMGKDWGKGGEGKQKQRTSLKETGMEIGISVLTGCVSIQNANV